jgi:hypothetical protein
MLAELAPSRTRQQVGFWPAPATQVVDATTARAEGVLGAYCSKFNYSTCGVTPEIFSLSTGPNIDRFSGAT